MAAGASELGGLGMSANSKTLSDAPARDVFCQQTEQAFSVIAPAGVGKTHAITERILTYAQRSEAVDLLPRLMVVTYTNRAAQEMQSRARSRLQEARISPEVGRAFNQTFFGTIHSLCVRLLRTHGHLLGLPPSPQLLERNDQVWPAFWASSTADDVLRSSSSYRALLQLCPFEAVQRLVQSWPSMDDFNQAEVLPERPLPKADDVLSYPASERSAKTVATSQTRLRQFISSLEEGDRQAIWPQPACRIKEFLERWQQALSPLREWQRQALIQLSTHLAFACREFRLEQGTLSYDDQISFAVELLRLPAMQAELESREHVVILDEAQDTDPGQFDVLRRLAGERLVMVGDPQQSIYPDRADLAVYLQQHGQYSKKQQQVFEVTFRCDCTIVDWVNLTMPKLLSGQDGQTRYMPLQVGPAAREGQVIRLPIGQKALGNTSAKPGVSDLAEAAAEEVATFLDTTGLEGLQARSWGEVALLCPRRQQLELLQQALAKRGLLSQLHSARDVRGEHPVYAWIAAFIWCLAHPRDGFELIGLLREVFGCSDHDLAMACGGEGAFWRIDVAPRRTGYPQVKQALEKLHQTWLESRYLALSEVLPLAERSFSLGNRLLQIRQLAAGKQTDWKREWQRLQLEAQAAEGEGLDLREFAQRLRDGFETSQEEAAVDPQAIQLLTCQKAKGLEWDAVVLPLFFQPLRERAAPYPRLRRQSKTGRPELQLDADDAKADDVSADELQHFYQRLLYVATTRARHTLVLADDEALFSTAPGVKTQNSLGKILLAEELAESNRKLWEQLPSVTNAELQLFGEVLSDSQPGVPKNKGAAIASLLVRAKRTAADFTRRVTPHSLAKMPSPEEPEARAETQRDEDRPELPAQTPATLYGTWWHELMEAIPWLAPEAELHELYHRHVEVSPDPVRSSREWELLVNSDFFRSLRDPDLLHRAEVPLLWKKDERLVVEGVADLAVWNPASKIWRLIDWKTNRLTGSVEEGIANLVEEYEPQIQAYLDAWRAFFPKISRVEGWLYATQLGQGIMVGGTEAPSR